MTDNGKMAAKTAPVEESFEVIVIGGGLSMEERVIPDMQAEIDKYYAGYGLGDKMRAEIVRSTYRSESNLYGATYNFIIRNT